MKTIQFEVKPALVSMTVNIPGLDTAYYTESSDTKKTRNGNHTCNTRC